MLPGEVRYCLLSFDNAEQSDAQSFGNAPLPISGLFNWARVFDGCRCFPRTAADFSRFNLFHVNLTTRNLCLLPGIFKRLPAGAKVLLNVDFAVEMWQNAFTYPDMFLEVIDRADYLFAVEPLMARLLSDNLKREVACIPHPTDVAGLEKLRTNERTNQVLVNIHRYDANFLLPHYATRNLPLEFQTIVAGSTVGDKQSLLHLYDFILEASPFESFMKILASTYCAYESYTMHSYGRFSVECAALGIPCVGPDIVHSMNICFPQLTTRVNDVCRGRDLLERLIMDKIFYLEAAQYAAWKSEEFSFDSCKAKMLEHISVERR